MDEFKCEDIQELIPLYLADAEGFDRQAFAVHIARCQRCREVLKEQARFHRSLSAYFSSLPEPPTRILDDIHRTVAPGSERSVTELDIASALFTNIGKMVRRVNIISHPAYWLSGLMRFPTGTGN